MLNLLIDTKSAALILKGFPWIMKDGLITTGSAVKLSEPGELVSISDKKGKRLGIGFLNKNTNIAIRILSLKSESIDQKFFEEKISKAIAKRKKYFAENYFRAVYGESDGLPGLIIDIYGKYAVAQVNAAGMERLQDMWLPALLQVMRAEDCELAGVYLDGSSKHMVREGLETGSKIIFGVLPEVVEVKENEFTYFADIIEGQKTGWFYDQRDNRKFLASLAKSKSVVDIYTHSGGFGLLCMDRGASSVELVDRSEIGLELAKKAVEKGFKNNKNIKFTKAEAFDFLDEAKESGRRFDIVNADPPAFIKNKKDVEAGLRGYEKLVRKCVELVNDNGIFAISSCSYFARPEAFQKAVEKAIEKSGRKFKLLRKSGADKDHPIHPMLGETNYLKFLVYELVD